MLHTPLLHGYCNGISMLADDLCSHHLILRGCQQCILKIARFLCHTSVFTIYGVSSLNFLITLNMEMQLAEWLEMCGDGHMWLIQVVVR
jgi:hypothetical protein